MDFFSVASNSVHIIVFSSIVVSSFFSLCAAGKDIPEEFAQGTGIASLGIKFCKKKFFELIN